MNKFFAVSHVSTRLHQGYGGRRKSKARIGEITTSHGVIKTPAFAPCATKGTIKALLPSLIKEIGIQTAFVNTYHLVTHPGADIIEKAGGIHKFSKLNIPLMSDSGGFQVFSLAKNSKARDQKFFDGKPQTAKNLVPSLFKTDQRKADVRGEEEPLVVKISEDGVQFRSTFDGAFIEFTPEKSMEFQAKICADINMAFDECITYGSSYEYSKKATERTHHWLLRSIGQYQKSIRQLADKNQKLYGVIQGGIYEDLRKKSAEFVVSQNTDGIAIGGVSVGESKKEMRDQISWVSDYLPKDRPVHLLGVGQIDDIIDLVKYGVDTFDCSEPTRLARMGTLYKISNIKSQITNKYQILNNKIKNEEIDITRTIYKNNLEKVDQDCDCYVCSNFTKSYLHHLFKQREILGYTLATYHNLWVMEKLFGRIRELI
ncbi:MAG: tRNA guanosine(34) transglycosylase Tgt, partial [Candidatus Roizmanbacteria bacterium]|nr:tRNA guanosine(34) transglycosylase Tgt [Candidatus Roizmanbacteria bacterium]